MAGEADNPLLPQEDAERLFRRFGEHLSPSLQRLLRFMGLQAFEWDGEGAVFRDHTGREYLDFHGCNGTLFLGRKHPRVTEAVRAQLDRLTVASRVFPHVPQVELAERLARISPGDLRYAFFCNSGAEAVEGALKTARIATGKTDFVATLNAFHGKTLGALSATGRELYRRPFHPLVPGFTHVPFGDAGAVEAAIGERTAAVIVEPIQGEGGVVLPPRGYLKRLREICDRHGALLILDEVQTGMGRTGTWFAAEYEGVVPDLLTTAKILSGGIVPIGVFLARAAVFEPLDENPFIHSSTFGGNALACAAGAAAVDAIEAEGLLRQAEEKGEYLLGALRQLAREHPQVLREVRGRGLMIGIELDREGLGGVIISECISGGLIVLHSLNNEKVIRFLPPAVVTREQMDRALDIFAAAVRKAAAIAEEV